LNIAATKVLNADNITVAGTTTGAPAPVVPSAPNIGGLTQASSTQAAASGSATDLQKQQQQQATQQEQPDSTITVEVLGYGGGEGTSDTSSGPASQ
jgi:hypothetical protein